MIILMCRRDNPAAQPFRRADGGSCWSHDIVGYIAHVDVDLDSLGPLARFLAEHTKSTAAHSGSALRGRSRLSEADLLRKRGRSDEEVVKLCRVYGDLENEYQVYDLAFDQWDHRRETPEEFFERHARRISGLASEIMMDRDGYPTIQTPVTMQC